MISRRKVALFISIISLATVGSFFSNCSKGLPSDVAVEQQQSSQGVQLSPVAADVIPDQVTTTGSAQIGASGGQPPYTYSVTGGAPTISSQGAITGPFVAGSAMTITITDSAQQSTQIALSVAAAPVPAPLLPCTTPFGTTISSGSSIVAFKVASIACYTTGVCQSETRVCTNGVLSGTFTAKTCTKLTCSTGGGGGGSGHYGG